MGNIGVGDSRVLANDKTFQLFEFRRTHADSVPDFVIEEQPAMIAALQQLISRDSSVFNRALRDACTRKGQCTEAAGSEL